MKSFKVREGKMLVDGVFYSDKPSDNPIKGKWGRIHSINVMGKQFFPYGGVFDDGTISVVDSTVETLEPSDSEVKVEKKKRAKKGSK
jgi:hypothetical protein